jgi:RNA polymerase sigma-70 factor (ECF subfamily)
VSNPSLHLIPGHGTSERGGLAFEELFESEKFALFRALCLVTHNRSEAEELTQDAFLKVFERWDDVRTMDDPRGYLYRTAMNAFRTFHRRAALGARRTIGLTPSDDSALVSGRRWC